VNIKLLPHVAWQMVGNEAVVINLASGQTVCFNATGSFIWKSVAAGVGSSLVRDFASEFHVTEEVARADVGQFVDYLVERGMVVTEP
jgi:hypothetical protein